MNISNTAPILKRTRTRKIESSAFRLKDEVPTRKIRNTEEQKKKLMDRKRNLPQPQTREPVLRARKYLHKKKLETELTERRPRASNLHSCLTVSTVSNQKSGSSGSAPPPSFFLTPILLCEAKNHRKQTTGHETRSAKRTPTQFAPRCHAHQYGIHLAETGEPGERPDGGRTANARFLLGLTNRNQ